MNQQIPPELKNKLKLVLNITKARIAWKLKRYLKRSPGKLPKRPDPRPKPRRGTGPRINGIPPRDNAALFSISSPELRKTSTYLRKVECTDYSKCKTERKTKQVSNNAGLLRKPNKSDDRSKQIKIGLFSEKSSNSGIHFLEFHFRTPDVFKNGKQINRKKNHNSLCTSVKKR